MDVLDGKIAIVTGTSRGVGVGIAHELLRAGATVIGCSRSPLGTIPGIDADWAARASQKVCDQGDYRSIDSFVADVVATHGRIDILVNNAGVYIPKPLAEATEADYDKTFDVNVKSLFLVTKQALERLADGGRIINIGSIVGERVPFPGASVYAASKFAVAGFTRAWSRELAPRQITVNNVQPGPIDTDMNPADADKNPAADFMRNIIPLGRYGTADEVAALVAFLASPQAAFITGASVTIDGGIIA